MGTRGHDRTRRSTWRRLGLFVQRLLGRRSAKTTTDGLCERPPLSFVNPAFLAARKNEPNNDGESTGMALAHPNMYVLPGGLPVIHEEESEDDLEQWAQVPAVPLTPLGGLPDGLVATARDGTHISANHIGKRVSVIGHGGMGVLRFLGFERGKGVIRCGVELDFFANSRAADVSDYFECEMGRGILVMPSKVCFRRCPLSVLALWYSYFFSILV